MSDHNDAENDAESQIREILARFSDGPESKDPKVQRLKDTLEAFLENWPAAGFVDTEIRCLTELESWNAEKEVQPRVQA